MYILVPSWCKVSSNAVKSGEKMMRSNAESLMAGAGAVDLYFDTESMQNIIQSLIGRYENGLHRYTHRVQWGESLLKTNGILCESFQIGD